MLCENVGSGVQILEFNHNCQIRFVSQDTYSELLFRDVPQNSQKDYLMSPPMCQVAMNYQGIRGKVFNRTMCKTDGLNAVLVLNLLALNRFDYLCVTVTVRLQY